MQLPIVVPPFFAEACGYRGTARYVALRWLDDRDELWFSDDGHMVRGAARPMSSLWRRRGGVLGLASYRAAEERSGKTPWLVVDRDEHRLMLGSAAEVWPLIEAQQPRRP